MIGALARPQLGHTPIRIRSDPMSLAWCSADATPETTSTGSQATGASLSTAGLAVTDTPTHFEELKHL
jgi:hypothetical protein